MKLQLRWLGARRTSLERYRVDSDRIDGAHHLMGVWGIVKSHKTWKNGLSVHLPCFAAMNCWGAKGITTTWRTITDVLQPLCKYIATSGLHGEGLQASGMAETRGMRLSP